MTPARLFSLAALTLLAACADPNDNAIRVTPATIHYTRAADPSPVQMLAMNFRVINRDNLDQFLTELEKQQGSAQVVFIAITTKDYENLSLNFADLRRYIEQQRAVIAYYRQLTHTEGTNNATTPAQR